MDIDYKQAVEGIYRRNYKQIKEIEQLKAENKALKEFIKALRA